MNYRVLREDDACFEVDGGDGRPFKVAKKGLGKATISKIQKFAKGGLVTDPAEDLFAPPGVTQNVTPEMIQSSVAVPPSMIEVPMTPKEPDRFDQMWAAFRSGQQDIPATPPPPPGRVGLPAADLPADARSTTSVGTIKAPAWAPPPPPDAAPAPAAATETAQAAPKAASENTSMRVRGSGGVPRAPAGPDGTTLGEKRALAGMDAAAQAEKDLADLEAKAAADREQALNEIRQRTEAEYREANGNAERLRKEIGSGKVNPHQFWESRNTGQKLSASIGMILGGFGAGLNGGPNYALNIIEKAIDRDIDAQKENINNKNSLLASYVQKGRDALSAGAMAKADALDIAAAQLKKAAAPLMGTAKAAEVEQRAGEFMIKADQLRKDDAFRRAQLGLQAAQFQFQKQMAGVEAAKALAGQDKETRERSVALPGGQIALAPTKEEAGKVRETLELTGGIKAAVQDMRDMRKNLGLGGALSAENKSRAEAMRASMVGTLSKLMGLGALSKSDFDLLYARVPDPGAIFTTDGVVNQKLDQLEQELNDKVTSAMKSRLEGFQSMPRVRVRPQEG